MISLKYGYVVEDNAQAIFLKNILPQIIEFLGFDSSFYFEEAINLILLTEAGNRKKLDEIYEKSAKFAFRINQLDAFFIGRDIDHKDFSKLIAKFNEMIIKIKAEKLNVSKIIIMLPIQCTEYWLRYEKLNKNPLDTTPPHNIDNQDKSTIKQNIYGTSCPPDQRKQIIKDLSQNIDIEFLYKNSKSFAHFVDQLKNFLNTITTSTKP